MEAQVRCEFEEKLPIAGRKRARPQYFVFQSAQNRPYDRSILD